MFGPYSHWLLETVSVTMTLRRTVNGGGSNRSRSKICDMIARPACVDIIRGHAADEAAQACPAIAQLHMGVQRSCSVRL